MSQGTSHGRITILTLPPLCSDDMCILLVWRLGPGHLLLFWSAKLSSLAVVSSEGTTFLRRVHIYCHNTKVGKFLHAILTSCCWVTSLLPSVKCLVATKRPHFSHCQDSLHVLNSVVAKGENNCMRWETPLPVQCHNMAKKVTYSTASSCNATKNQVSTERVTLNQDSDFITPWASISGGM